MLKLPYKKLSIWQKAMDIAETVYTVTKDYPKEERFGLIAQMRAAATAVPSNIAEGSQRTTNKDFANFILIAKGSLAELETQTLLSQRFGYLSDAKTQQLLDGIDELSRMMYSFRNTLTTDH
ncbi:MAG: four helix bundle protein [Candidatus Peribacteraceae bacterium]|nr:four helix bundle protein [Candidatus Peribacteraceae bacterium]